jgi:hypothetical protein
LDSLEPTPREPAGAHDGAAFRLRWTFERADLEDAIRAQPAFRRLRRFRRWVLVLVVLVGVLFAFRPTWSSGRWDVFRQVHQTDRAFLLSFSPKASSPVLVVPKRALAGQADIDALGALLHRMIGGAKTPAPGRPG